MSANRDPNPFRPPQADLGAGVPRERAPAWKAVLFGALADVGLTMVLGIAFMMAYLVFLLATGATEEQVEAFFTAPSDTSAFTIVLTIIGTFGSALGGYVCARTARHSEYRLAWVLIALALVLGWTFLGEETSATYAAVTTVLTIGGTLLGTWAGVQQNVRRA